MSLLRFTDGVWRVGGWPPWIVNCYLVEGPEGDILIDAGTRWGTGRLLRQLRGRNLVAVALTHCHPDHQGAAAEVCRRYKIPLLCHSLDADVMEGKAPMGPRNAWIRVFDRLLSGPPHPVAQRLEEGDQVGELRVLHAPGHTPGHVFYYRERDQFAIVGDVASHAWMGGRGYGQLSEPPHFFSVDPAENRQSMRRLLDLQPATVAFGHGPPLYDTSRIEPALARTLAGAARAGSW